MYLRTKVLDAWGKLPSGLLEGNLYELGAFSECFHIERNDKHYDSKYCMGELAFDVKGITAPKSRMNKFFFPENFQIDDEQIVPRMMPQ